MEFSERYRIQLDTSEDIKEFHKIATSLTDHIIMIDDGNSGCRINAKSLLGLIATLDFESLYVVSDKPIYHYISRFVI